MGEMKFKFTIQDYQTEAVDSVVNVFAGQPFQDKIHYRRDIGAITPGGKLFDYKGHNLPDEELFVGFSNAPVALDAHQLLQNIRDIQNDNNIRQSSGLAKHMGACSLDVEMETGTGKTYVYIKTMFELNKRYGVSLLSSYPRLRFEKVCRKVSRLCRTISWNSMGKKQDFLFIIPKI